MKDKRCTHFAYHVLSSDLSKTLCAVPCKDEIYNVLEICNKINNSFSLLSSLLNVAHNDANIRN